MKYILQQFDKSFESFEGVVPVLFEADNIDDLKLLIKKFFNSGEFYPNDTKLPLWLLYFEEPDYYSNSKNCILVVEYVGIYSGENVGPSIYYEVVSIDKINKI